MHHGGRPSLRGLDWAGRRVTASYPDSKLFLTAFAPSCVTSIAR